MPRQARKMSGSGIYHAMLRGVNRSTIFHDDDDCEAFLAKLSAVRQAHPFDLYAWCLMGNHVHLLLRVPDPNGDGFFFTAAPGQRNRLPLGDKPSGVGALGASGDGSSFPHSCEIKTVPYDQNIPYGGGGLRETVPISQVPCEIETVPSDQAITLSSLFKRLGVRYAAWYNHKYQRTGHLFQDRFRSVPVETDEQFLAACRYILRNPVKAGLCAEIGQYRWCGIDPKALPLDITPKQLDDFLHDEQGSDIPNPFPERLTDREAETLIREMTGVACASELAAMPKAQLVPLLRALQEQGANVLQLSRLTGISKSNLARWLS